MKKGILKCISACLAMLLCTPLAMAQDDAANADTPAETSSETVPEAEAPAAEAPDAPIRAMWPGCLHRPPWS